MALAFKRVCLLYFLKSSDNASLNAAALAAMTCISGPPCNPGNTALSIKFPKSLLLLIMILKFFLHSYTYSQINRSLKFDLCNNLLDIFMVTLIKFEFLLKKKINTIFNNDLRPVCLIPK